MTIGYLSHLVLDELWSIEWKRGRWQLKRSFGTALKLWSSNRFANVSTYAKLAVLSLLAFADPVVMDRIETRIQENKDLPRTALEHVETLWR